ncbi:MAG: class I SAM-dependent methyltransferase [Ruminococcus sp.]|nr:class I SAM-dependent methyltransferase [Ruminococcus sp.]
MNKKRIYGDKCEIDTLRTKELYNARANNLENMKSPYTSVLLGDQNPEYANKWNIVEKELILPFMQADKTKSALDLGCGIGRWAESLLPLCKSYTGVDFSECMIEEAKKRCGHLMNDASCFVCNSVQGFLRENYTDRKYDIIIISYVCMYINDSEIECVMKKISEIASKNCVIYFIDTVGVEKRLTLNEIYSEALKSNYSAIYRTVNEYNELYKILEKSGFEKVGFGFMPKLNSEEAYAETDRHYIILKRC